MIVLLAAAAAIPAVVVVGGRAAAPGPHSTPVTPSPVSASSAITTASAAPGISVPEPPPAELEFGDGQPQATFLRATDGAHIGTANERHARPALSLAKLYIADYVLEHGTAQEQFDAVQMLVDSDDQAAADLHALYPDSIDATAEKRDLYSTRGAAHWGHSVTSTYDAASFLAQLMAEDTNHPILVALSVSSEVAADGYAQDFGTAQLPGAIGTKWGWSDDRSLHSSVSFGPGWVAAAAVTGTPDDLSAFAVAQMSEPAQAAAESR